MTKQTDSDTVALRDRPIEITDAMIEAGLSELREVGFDDPGYLVRSIYMAMEFERLDSLGELGSLG